MAVVAAGATVRAVVTVVTVVVAVVGAAIVAIVMIGAATVVFDAVAGFNALVIASGAGQQAQQRQSVQGHVDGTHDVNSFAFQVVRACPTMGGTGYFE